MELNHSIPKTNHIHKSIPNLLFTAALLLCTAIINPITARADTIYNTEVDSIYESEETDNAGGTSVYLGTYPRDCGYQGQGILLYLLERNGGGPVAGTTPKAFACSTEVGSIELHAQDKYNRYPEVTTWERGPGGGLSIIKWASEDYPNPVPNTGGFLTNKSSVYNTQAIKNWLKTEIQTVSGDKSTRGINMVQTLWGQDIAKDFASEKYLLVAEPIVAITFSQFKYLELPYPVYSDDCIELLGNFKFIRDKLFKNDGSPTEPYTQASSALKSFLDDNIEALCDILEAKQNYPSLNFGSTIEATVEGIHNVMAKSNFSENGLRIYHPTKTIAGTPKYLSEYYDNLTLPQAIAANIEWHKSSNGNTWFKKSANAASRVSNPTSICANANFTLWPVGRDVRIYHSTSSMQTYAIGMLAMLAWHDENQPPPVQTTCDESKLTEYPPEHPAPIESEGTTTIIKSYRIRNTETNTLTDRGTHTRSNLSNQILIEDEDDYKVIAWKTSTENITNLANFSVTWESSVPGIIGEQGDTITQVTLPSTHKYIYVLLEKSDNPDNPDEHTNYTIPQSSITRHIYLSQPDKRLGMPKIEAHTFTWYIPSFTEGSCKHTYTCNSSDCSNKSYGTCNCNPCKSDCTIYLKSILPI